MKTHSINALTIVALAATAPTSASADAKDVIIGGILGAAINQELNNQKKKKQQKTVVYKTPSLNSQYTKAERIQIQTSLRDRGYDIGVIDGILGKNSRRVISMFQGSLGAQQTGQLTRDQFARLTGAGSQFNTAQTFDRPLIPQETALLQQSLMMLGYYQGPIDGIDSPLTQGASMAFLASNGMNPMQVTKVNALVMATTRAGIPTPPNLVHEASMQMNGVNSANPFGNAAQGNGFGAPAQQAFGAQPQQQGMVGGQQAFVPNSQFQQQQQGVTQNNALFGAPQAPVQQQQLQPGVAAPGTTQPQLFQQQPQQVPQGGQGTAVFAASTPAQQPIAQPQSTLDIFSPGSDVAQVGQNAIPVPQQGQSAVPQQLFADPNATVAGGTQSSTGVFGQPSNN